MDELKLAKIEEINRWYQTKQTQLRNEYEYNMWIAIDADQVLKLNEWLEAEKKRITKLYVDNLKQALA